MEVLRPIHSLSDLIREYKLSSIDIEEFLKRLLEKLQMAKCGKVCTIFYKKKCIKIYVLL